MNLCLCVTLLESQHWILYLKLGLNELVPIIFWAVWIVSLDWYLEALMCFRLSRQEDGKDSLWLRLEHQKMMHPIWRRLQIFFLPCGVSLHQTQFSRARDSAITCLSLEDSRLTKSWLLFLGNNRWTLSIEQYDCLMYGAQPLDQSLVIAPQRSAASQATPGQKSQCLYIQHTV